MTTPAPHRLGRISATQILGAMGFVILFVVPFVAWTPTAANLLAATGNSANAWQFASYRQAVLADSPAVYLPLEDAAPPGSTVDGTQVIADLSGADHFYVVAPPADCSLNGGNALKGKYCNGVRQQTQGPAVLFGEAGPPGLGPAPSTAMTMNYGGDCFLPPGAGSGNNAVSGATAWNAPPPDALTLEVWLKTTTAAGGPILGYSASLESTTSASDRTLFVTSGGRPAFAVDTVGLADSTPATGVAVAGNVLTVTSPTAVNDGQWHHVAATLQPSGSTTGASYSATVTLYVDGAVDATYTTTAALNVAYTNAKWRVHCYQVRSSSDPAVGTNRIQSAANLSTPISLVGSLASLAVYYGSAASATAVLSARTLRTHYLMGL